MVDIILLNLGWNTDFVKHLQLHKKKNLPIQVWRKVQAHTKVIWNAYPKSEERNGVHADIYISLMSTVVQTGSSL